MRMAVVTTNRTVYLFDENGDQREKFPTKAADTKVTGKNYVVKAMAFSPDSSKLAICQSDNIVFIYKLGSRWGEKKAICNKYPQSTAITCLTWPLSHQNEFFFGLADGKVKLGNLRNNKSVLIYGVDEYVVSICSSPDGSQLLAGHLDGTMYIFSVSTTGSVTKTKFGQHSCAPYCLAWGQNIVAAGADLKITFYEASGQPAQKFDYNHDDKEKEYTVAEFSPSGQSLVVGGFNRFRAYQYSTRRSQWEESAPVDVPNLYAVTAVSWKRDGSRVFVGGLCGGVDMYDACLKRYKYKGKFEMVYTSPSQVIVRRLSNNERITMKSENAYEITKINVYNDRYIVAMTASTLLLGDMAQRHKLTSEIEWQATGHERFFFDNPGVAMVFNAGELTIVEYGHNEPLGLCRTEHVSSHLISVRIDEHDDTPVPGAAAAGDSLGDEQPQQVTPDEPRRPNKKIAYLIDLQTVHIQDLVTGQQVATISHDARIDWLELNASASKLLFRDKRRSLNLFDLATQTRTTLLTLCSYVQWVPKSDVVVSQSRADLCVWYNIDAPEKVTMFPIKGDIIDIERTDGKTEVVVDEGMQTTYVALDEALIAFGAAVERRRFERAMDILETLPPSPEAEAMWSTLSQLTLHARKLPIAERCFAALGDVARARYLHKINQIVAYAESKLDIVPGTDYYVVKAKLEMLHKNFTAAEQVYLEQGQVEDAMEMFQELHKWEEAIKVAENSGHPEVANLRSNYYQWLIETRQEERAALLKEKEGDSFEAINLYLKGGLPARAAQLVVTHNLTGQAELVERIAEALYATNLFEKAGFFFEKLDKNERALDAYRRGHAYRAAVELCRRTQPSRVITLEAEWADWLVSVGQVDQAINHFIEAGQYTRAIESAIESKQWNKAVTIVDNLEPEHAKKFYKQIARHYEATLNYEQAEKYFVKGGLPEEAVDMYTKANMWDAAHKIAVSFMAEKDVALLYMSQAQRLEMQGKYRDAEKLYIVVGQEDQAINMYKKAHKFDDMIRLVTTYHKDLLAETHLHLAQQLEAEGNYKEAEKHYNDGGDWHSSVNMYRAIDQWQEALRVAKQFGGQQASTQVACVWARSVGGEAGINLLLKFGLLDAAVEYSMEVGQFKRAEEICRAQLKKKLPEVFLKHAMVLEDEMKFHEAEQEFIKAGSPKDAVDMYIHQQDWDNAKRVAESFSPTSMADIWEAQARLAAQAKAWRDAEQLFIKAGKPEEAVRMYQEQQMLSDAARVKRDNMTDLQIRELPVVGNITEVQRLINNGEYVKAIEVLLKKTKENTQSHDELEEAWDQAWQLVLNHMPERTNEIAKIIAKRYVEIKRFQQAADKLEEVDDVAAAIDVYVMGEMWEQARALAASKAPEFLEHIAELKLRALVARNEWDKVFEIARAQGQDVLGKFLAQYATALVKEDQITQAISVFVKHGAIPINENFALYRELARTVFQMPGDSEELEQPMTLLRKMMFKLVQNLHEADAPSASVTEFERFAMIAHLNCLKEQAKLNQLPQLVAKICTSLIRYAGDVPADKAYYEAGVACKEVNATNMAFVFLNRYLDLAEALEEGDATILENADFENTDVPYDIPLPKRQYLDEDRRESVRSWVLQSSLDTSMNQTLSTRPCDNCAVELYEASTICYQCKNTYDCCIVTGYPVLRNSKINCTSCGKPANREDWNKWVVKCKVCPWCNSTQTPSY